MEKETMKQEINTIINKACRGYVWGEMYVSQIWQVINKQDLPETEKQRALFKYIRELEYATDCEIDIDELDEILAKEYTIETLQKEKAEAERDGYPTDWYDGMIEQLQEED